MSTELLREIEEQGRAKVEQIESETEREVERRRHAAEQQMTQWREERTAAAERQLENDVRLVESRARAKAREVVLRAKAEAAEQLSGRLSEQAKALREDKRSYKPFIKRALAEVEAEIEGKIVLQIDPRDEGVFEELIDKKRHSIETSLTTLGGFVATSESGQMLVDNRLEVRIANVLERHRAELSSSLFEG